MYHATGLTGWERGVRAETLRPVPEDLTASLAQIDRSLNDVLQRLERLEAEKGD
jgi:hypothetical protein